MIINEDSKVELSKWIQDYIKKIQPKYSSHLYSESNSSVLSIKEVAPTYDETKEEVDARVILRDNF